MCLLMSLEFRHGREGLPTAVYLAHERTLVRVDSANVQSEQRTWYTFSSPLSAALTPAPGRHTAAAPSVCS